MKLLCTLSLLMFIHHISTAHDDGSLLFDETKIVEIRLTFYQPDFWNLLLDTHHTEDYVAADLTIDASGVRPNVGVRLKGQSSFQIPSDKKSIKIDLNEFVPGQNYDGLKKFNLNNCFGDPTLLREKIMYDFCKIAGIPAPRANFAKVYINDEYWGLYTIIDEVNEDFLGRVFDSDEGNLFKGDPSGDLYYYGDDYIDYKSKYQLHTNTAENDWSDLIDLIDRINNTSDANYFEEVFDKMDAQSFYKYWAVNMLFANIDSYIGMAHNYYLYDDISVNKFKWILWDANECFGNYHAGIGADEISSLNFYWYAAPPEQRPIIERSILNDSTRNHYLNKIYYFKENWFNESYLFPIIDSYADLIRDDVYADTSKMFTNEEFELNMDSTIYSPGAAGGGHIPGLKQFITERYNYTSHFIDSVGFIPFYEGIETIADNAITIFPVPCNKGQFLFITCATPLLQPTMTIYNFTGKIISEQHLYLPYNISTASLNSGIYLYAISANGQRIKSGKFVII